MFDFGKAYQYASVKSMRKEITTLFWLHMHCGTTALYLKRKSSLICVLNNDFPRCNIWKRRLGNLKSFQLIEKQNRISLLDKVCERNYASTSDEMIEA